MSTLTFDTLAYAKRLKAAGFTEQQAEVAAEAQRETIESVVAELESRHLKDVATKLDIETVRKEMAELKSDLTRWIIGAGFLQTALIAALLLKSIK